MKTSLISAVSILLLSIGVSALEADDSLNTRTLEVEVVAEEEFDEEVQRLPALMEKMQIERAAAENPYIILPHRPNYFLPLTYQRSPSNRELERSLSQFADEPVRVEDGYDHPEAIFQLSVKYLLAKDLIWPLTRLEIGYTNISYWQVYNGDISRPFRETNHEPELMFTWNLRDYWVDSLSVSLNHQSNGQNSTLSRSWNRLIFGATTIVGDGILSGKAWWRLPESEESDPEDPSDDDNPDIISYMGYGEVAYLHLLDKHQFEIMVRNNLDSNENRGAVRLGYTFPLTSRIKGYVQYFNGYGESLIDYDRFQERIGVGIKLSDWF